MEWDNFSTKLIFHSGLKIEKARDDIAFIQERIQPSVSAVIINKYYKITGTTIVGVGKGSQILEWIGSNHEEETKSLSSNEKAGCFPNLHDKQSNEFVKIFPK